MNTITVNRGGYRLPKRPVVVICIAGCDPEYLKYFFITKICRYFFALGVGQITV